MVKKSQKKDPHAELEAQKYKNPIPSRQCILNYFEESGEPLTHEELVQLLDLRSDEEKEALNFRLRAMVRDAQLIRMRSGKFGLIDKLDLIPGRIIGHADGHGFLVPDDSSSDLFVSSRQMRQVFDGDRVLARVARVNARDKREAAIIRVLERRHQRVTGRFFLESGQGFVVPDNKRLTQDVIIPAACRKNAEPGEVVIADITSYPTMRTQAVGEITEILGGHMAPGMETDVAIRSHNIRYIWPESVEKALAEIPSEVLEADCKNRVDMRNVAFVTIDGEDSRDFDDAVYCEPFRSGWKLYVAIADVGHYVKQGSPLDREAFERGNSTYFPSRVVPMLPECLSNGLCSLNPAVDRLVMVCEMQINKKGDIKKTKFYEAVINSKGRLTYNEVSQMLLGVNKPLEESRKDVFPHVKQLHELYLVLYAGRVSRGAISFELGETKVVFDENKKIKALLPTQRNDAHRLIEECMLCANISAAEFILKNKYTGIYRVHPGPKPEKIKDLMTFLGELGLGLGGGSDPTPMDYAKLLQQVELRQDKHLIQMVLLRSMMQAQYSVNNKGHFGLAFEAYTHFTSPIRRYPDLLVHRVIKAILKKRKLTSDEEAHLVSGASQASITERRSDEASRDVLSWLKCEFMMDRVGEAFDGVISGVMNFGLFVELNECYVEGLVHISNLENDYYHFDAIRHHLVGQRTGKSYCVGDPVKVRVARVDLDQRQIDFVMMDIEKPKKKPKKKRRKR